MGHILAAFGYSIFEGSQAFIVDPVGGPHASFSFVAQKADVDPLLAHGATAFHKARAHAMCWSANIFSS